VLACWEILIDVSKQWRLGMLRWFDILKVLARAEVPACSERFFGASKMGWHAEKVMMGLKARCQNAQKVLSAFQNWFSTCSENLIAVSKLGLDKLRNSYWGFKTGSRHAEKVLMGFKEWFLAQWKSYKGFNVECQHPQKFLSGFQNSCWESHDCL